jgi:hypothetical protein
MGYPYEIDDYTVNDPKSLLAIVAGLFIIEILWIGTLL